MNKTDDIKTADIIYLLLVILIIGCLSIIQFQRYRIAQLEEREPIIIYQVDNAGAAMVGRVTGKKIIDGAHTIEVGAYGLFLVTKEQYDKIQVGDEAPEYLTRRGS